MYSNKEPPIKATAWKGCYQVLPDGRCKITAPALLALTQSHPDRILDVMLRRRPARILLLDKPLVLGEPVADSPMDELYLHRIRLNELPGWPPKLASTVHAKEAPGLLECTLKKASYLTGGGPGEGGILLALEHAGRRFQAWHVECPADLLLCAEATLNQEGVVGRKLVDLQDLRLIGSD